MTAAVVGFLTGVLASMGLGGGFILVVWLTLFEGVSQRTAQGINVLFFIPIAFIALVMHLRSGLVNKALVKSLLFGGVVGAVIGTAGAALIGNSLLQKLYALFLLAFGLRELFGKAKPDEQSSAAPEEKDPHKKEA